MSFDPSQPFNVVSSPSNNGFDPSQPHTVISDPSKVGGLESFASGVGSAIPGNQVAANLIGEGKDWSNEKENAWQQHPIAYGSGKATGIVAAPAALALAAPETAAVAFGTAGLAAQGALGAEDNSFERAAQQGDILPATAEMLKVGAVGGVTGVALGAISNNLPKITEGLTGIPASAIANRATPGIGEEIVNMTPEKFGSSIGEAVSKQAEINPSLRSIAEQQAANGTPIPASAEEALNTSENTVPLAKSAFKLKVSPENENLFLPTEQTEKAVSGTAQDPYKQNLIENMISGSGLPNVKNNLNLFEQNQAFQNANLTKTGELLVAGGGALLGHPYLAALLGYAQHIPGTAGHIAEGIEQSVIGGGVATAADMVRALGPYAKPLLSSLQSGGINGLSAMHYILSSNYPGYAKLMQDGNNQNGK